MLDKKVYAEEKNSKTISDFVQEKLLKGERFSETEIWAKEWLDNYSKDVNNKEVSYYRAFHSIPEVVVSLEKQMNIKPSGIKTKRTRKYLYDVVYKEKAENLLKKNNYVTEVPWDELKSEEYKNITLWLQDGKALPEHLGGIIKKKITFEERYEKFFKGSLKGMVLKTHDTGFTIFILYFFVMLMLINL